MLGNVHPQTASFGPQRRFRSSEILEIAHYACYRRDCYAVGFKIAQALLQTKINHLWKDTV